MQSTATPTASVFADPFARKNGHRFEREPIHTERLLVSVGTDGTVTKSSLSDWVAGASLRSVLGGNESLTDPISENVWLAACCAVKSIAARSTTLRFYASDDPEADDEIKSDSDPIVKLFAKPNPVQLIQEIVGRSVYHRAEKEDWWFLADAKGKAVASTVSGEIELPAQIVQCNGTVVHLDEEDALGFPKTWRYSTAKGQQVVFPQSASLLFCDENPRDLFRGLGAIKTLARELSAYFQAQRYNEGLARNSGEMSGVLLLGDSASAEQLEQTRVRVDDFVTNPENRGKQQVFGGKDIQWIPNQISPKDMEFESMFRWVREAICSRMGVPLPLLGVMENATDNNYEHARRSFWEDTMIPFLRSIEFVLNNKFFPRLRDAKFKSYRAYFDTDSIEALREDNTDKIVKASTVSVQQAAPINAILPAMGVDAKIEGGDVAPAPIGGIAVEDPTDETPAADGAAPDAASGELVGQDVQSQVLNGAQIAQAVDIVELVTAAKLPRDSGLAMLQQFFGLTPAQAEAVMGSAGTKTPLVENPNPAADARAEAMGDALADGANSNPPADDEPDPPADGEKSFRLVKAGGPITERSARVAYYEAHEKAVGQPGEKALFPVSRKYLKRYADAYESRVRQYAKTGHVGKSATARAFAADWIEREISADEANLEAQLRILDLNREEWDKKLIELFAPKLSSVAADALRHAAEELETVSIGVGNPRMLQALSAQEIKLAHDLNGVLAEQVRTALMEKLAADTSIGDLQSRLREVLPDLDETIAKGIGDRDARALRIARTESGKSATTARFEQFKHDGVTQGQWITQGDGEVRESHQAVDGEVRNVGSAFSNGLLYPLDPSGSAAETINCFPSGTPVLTKRGEVAIEDVRCGDEVLTHRARWRRVIERHVNRAGSQLLQVATADGRAFGVTPTHKLFVRGRGWIEAHALERGDELVDPATAIALRDQIGHVDHPHPELLEESMAEGVQVRRRAEHFDAHANLWQVQVDEVVAGPLVLAAAPARGARAEAELALRLDAQASGRQGVAHLDLPLAASRAVAVRAALGAVPLEHRAGRPASVVGIDPLNGNGFAPAPDRNAALLQHAPNHSRLRGSELAHEIAVGRELDRVPTMQEVAERLARRGTPSLRGVSALPEALASERAEAPRVGRPVDDRRATDLTSEGCHVVHSNAVVTVDTLEGRFDVFNLGVEEDMSYFAAGFLGRNCRCAYAPVVEVP